MEWYEEEAVQEPSDNKSDVAAVLAAVRVSVNPFAAFINSDQVTTFNRAGCCSVVW